MLLTFARFPSMLCFPLLISSPRHPVKLKIVEKRIKEREIKVNQLTRHKPLPCPSSSKSGQRYAQRKTLYSVDKY